MFARMDSSYLRHLLRRGPFVSHAAILGLARFLSLITASDPRAMRVRVARMVLLAWRPRVVFLTDESGSGQALLRAARSLGIRVEAIQHGDFQPDNEQYALAEGPTRDVEPADVLWVWSPWFRQRLCEVSPIYDAQNTRVAGRLRAAPRRPESCLSTGAAAVVEEEVVRVLLLSESHPAFIAEVAPFLEVLRRTPGISLSVRPHPAEAPDRWQDDERSDGDLEDSFARCDVVVGVSSSALLEALWHGRPAIGLVTAQRRDPAGYGPAGAVELCEDPIRLPELCRRVFASRSAEQAEAVRDLVWGGAPDEPVQAILDASPGRVQVPVNPSGIAPS